MSKEQIALKWLNGAGNSEDLSGLSFEDFVWLWENIQKSNTMNEQVKAKNMMLLTQHTIRMLKNPAIQLWYASIVKEDGCSHGTYSFPYQESSNYGQNILDMETTSIRIFGTMQAAQKYADSINRQVGKLRRIPANTIIVRPEYLSASPTLSMPLDDLERMDVSLLYLGNSEVSMDISSILSIQKKQVELAGNVNFGALCPSVNAKLCKFAQAKAEYQSEKILREIQDEIAVDAAYTLIGCVVHQSAMESGEVRPLKDVLETEDGQQQLCVMCFTDWESLCKMYGYFNSVLLCQIRWEELAEMDCPVCLNGVVVYSPEYVRAMLPYTHTADIALQYIEWEYIQEDETTTEVECESVLQDIINAPPICKEFYSALTLQPQTTEDGKTGQKMVMNVPEDGVKVLDGTRAKDLLDSGLCQNPAAAYHVMALLYNDKDGSAKTAFQNAELYR